MPWDLDAEERLPGVRVGVEVDQAEGAGALRDRPDVRFGDRVVALEDHREGAGVDDVADGPLDRLVRSGRVGRDHRCVAEVDGLHVVERLDLGVEMATQPAAGRANLTRPEAGARPTARQLVHRRADHRDVDIGEVRDVLGVGQAAEREQARVLRSPGVGRALV